MKLTRTAKALLKEVHEGKFRWRTAKGNRSGSRFAMIDRLVEERLLEREAGIGGGLIITALGLVAIGKIPQ